MLLSVDRFYLPTEIAMTQNYSTAKAMLEVLLTRVSKDVSQPESFQLGYLKSYVAHLVARDPEMFQNLASMTASEGK